MAPPSPGRQSPSPPSPQKPRGARRAVPFWRPRPPDRTSATSSRPQARPIPAVAGRSATASRGRFSFPAMSSRGCRSPVTQAGEGRKNAGSPLGAGRPPPWGSRRLTPGPRTPTHVQEDAGTARPRPDHPGPPLRPARQGPASAALPSPRGRRPLGRLRPGHLLPPRPHRPSSTGRQGLEVEKLRDQLTCDLADLRTGRLTRLTGLLDWPTGLT